MNTLEILRQAGALLRCAILSVLALVFFGGFFVSLIALTATHLLFSSEPPCALEE